MENKVKTFGSVCSGIEAASFVLKPLGFRNVWMSEIDKYPCAFLKERYPGSENVGDMNDIPGLLADGRLEAPDLLCGGTPCQAFSLAGWKNGLNDHRGQLTLKYIDILDEIDKIRENQGRPRAQFFWENVEGVLTDKTNAFGCFLAGLAGNDEAFKVTKWTNGGVVHGKVRNIAWRVLDAKYFGLPQQRRRIYVLGGGKDFFPENVLFDVGKEVVADPYRRAGASNSLFFDVDDDVSVPMELRREIGNHHIEIFRTYTDCLYAAYGTKWNGNAAAFNGSLFVAQDGRLRRLTPIECERLMGFPDNYTLLKGCTLTNRYRATGNSWAVNVIRWIMGRMVGEDASANKCDFKNGLSLLREFTNVNGEYVNASFFPYDFRLANFLDFIDTDPDEKLYISRQGCGGILRRKYERGAGMNKRLEDVLLANSGFERP